jgi:plasmid stabilization system protein ParE
VTQFRILDEALVDLDEAATWYEKQSVGLGTDLLVEFAACLRVALEAPGVGTLVEKSRRGNEVRRFRLQRFNRYAIVIAIIGGETLVVALEHSSRRPEYWRERIG